MFIVLEGPKGSGKSTLAARFCSEVSSSVSLYRFPSPTPLGDLIRKGLVGEVSIAREAYLLLWAADGVVFERGVKKELVEQGHIVSDRHPMFSMAVYQQDDHAKKDIEAVLRASYLVPPDLLVILDAPATLLQERRWKRDKARDVVFEGNSLLRDDLLRKRYLDLYESYPGRKCLLDASKPIEELLTSLFQITDLERKP